MIKKYPVEILEELYFDGGVLQIMEKLIIH